MMHLPPFLILFAFPEIGTVGLAAGAGFFLILVAVAYIAFRMLKKTVRIALRMAIVAAILLIALVGGIAIYWKGSSSTSPGLKPAATRTR